MEPLIDKSASDNEKRFQNNIYNKPFINILGFDLYLDDILILCILFSMYKDGIKDDALFIALVLLLFS